jgi:hypothetical protein
VYSSKPFSAYLLFASEERIGYLQRDHIISLQTRLAARTLSFDQEEDIKRRVEQFLEQKFQIIPYWKNTESRAIPGYIGVILENAGWIFDNPTT